jgi:hypothetical protein
MICYISFVVNNSWISSFNYCTEGALMLPAVVFELGSLDPISSRQNDRMHVLQCVVDVL